VPELSESVSAGGELPQLRAALASRPVIDLAKGVLMAVHRCDEDTAFAELARVSMESNLKVARLAELLVDQVLLPRPAVQVDDVPLRACAAVERWVRALPAPPAGQHIAPPELRG
jgi:ANTAR domain